MVKIENALPSNKKTAQGGFLIYILMSKRIVIIN